MEAGKDVVIAFESRDAFGNLVRSLDGPPCTQQGIAADIAGADTVAWDLTRVQCASPQVGGPAGQNVTLEAIGPQIITFAPLASAPTKHSAVLTAAALYVVHARLASAAVAGWPRVLHVVPAASEPSRCHL